MLVLMSPWSEEEAMFLPPCLLLDLKIQDQILPPQFPSWNTKLIAESYVKPGDNMMSINFLLRCLSDSNHA